jgi:hypothetical protein
MMQQTISWFAWVCLCMAWIVLICSAIFCIATGQRGPDGQQRWQGRFGREKPVLSGAAWHCDPNRQMLLTGLWLPGEMMRRHN